MEERVCELRIEIARLIKHPAVLQNLVPHVISQVKAKEIKRLYDISTERANHRLLDLLFKSEEPGKWTAFKQALENANYPFLAELLSTGATCYNQQRRILEIFAPFLERVLHPSEIIDKLCQLDVIDQHDKEVVLAEQTNRGPIAATIILLDRIQTHLAPEKWYLGFLEALYQTQHEDLVKEIDPDFFEKKKLKGDNFDYETGYSGAQEAVVLTEAANSDNRTISENINKFRNVIPEMLDLPSVIDILIPTVVSFDKRNELLQTYEYDQAKAIDDIIDNVISTENGEEFVHCLERSDYPYLARLLRNQNSVGHNTYCQKIIQIFSTNIQEQISTHEVISSLAEQNVINQHDAELIQSEHRRKGNIAAAVILLDRIQSRLSPEEWYKKFLYVLNDTSHEHIVEMIEPDFRSHPDQFLKKMEITDRTDVSCESVPQSGNVIEEEIAAICRMKQAYFLSKSVAKEQIYTEQKDLIKFVGDRFDKLKMDLEQKVLTFETELDKYRNAVLLLSERNLSNTQNEEIESELEALKQQYPHLSGNTTIEVKFERNLTMHFLESVGYLTEIRPANIAKDKLKIEEEVHHRVPLTLDDIKLDADLQSHASTSDEGSSFVQVTGPVVPADDTTDYESDLEINDKQNENDISRDDIEQIMSKKVFALSQIPLNDMIVLPGQLLAGICTKPTSVIIMKTESFEIVSRIPLSNKNSSKLALLNEYNVAVMSSDLDPLNVVSLNERKTAFYEWDCKFDKIVMVSHENNVYILCLGRHLHIYSLDTGKQDMYRLGFPTEEFWHPISAALNASGVEVDIFICGVDSVDCFRILDKERIQHQWSYCNNNENPVEIQLFIGISMFAQNIVLLDKNNNSVLRITSVGGFYRDEILSSSFSDCDLVAFDPKENSVHLVSYRYNEYKKVKLVSISLDNAIDKDDDEEYDPYVNVT